MTDSIKFLREWAKDIRHVSGFSADADKLEEAAAALEARDAKITDLQAQLRLTEDQITELQARDDFLMKVLGMAPDDVKELLEMLNEKRKS